MFGYEMKCENLNLSYLICFSFFVSYYGNYQIEKSIARDFESHIENPNNLISIKNFHSSIKMPPHIQLPFLTVRFYNRLCYKNVPHVTWPFIVGLTNVSIIVFVLYTSYTCQSYFLPVKELA